MVLSYVCDDCKKPLVKDEDFGGKALVYNGRRWTRTSRTKGMKALRDKHYYYCKECFKIKFPDFELKSKQKWK